MKIDNLIKAYKYYLRISHGKGHRTVFARQLDSIQPYKDTLRLLRDNDSKYGLSKLKTYYSQLRA